MKRTTVRRAGVVALALTSLMGVGATAEADAQRLASSCGASVCLYEHDDYAGAQEDFLFTSNGCANVGALNNKASSMRNPSAGRMQFYNSANCSGSYGYAAAPRSADSDLTNNGFDNLTSSVRRVNP
ncbi:peptidase inhibitor family I36 protein [Nonomuraea sp. NEAU-A123]|uniref:peptidase inhibitor family I36 protein n=1 Tax=Nonomuraea sp. NEAU-A123 TaxID=2839649 RepID=UPI001BE495EA|nr:peptidase inhibitor family I36 protein [Nonomuraea sp. NEAU-A123]MBT2233598.1 peptidase inhibitor family I36 protein [Nonomuraea sp. NEAU-A123]